VEEICFPDIDLYGFNGVRHTEIHTAEPIVPYPSACEAKVAN